MARYWQLLVKAKGDTKPAQKAMRDMRRASKNLQSAIGIDFRAIGKYSALALGAGLAASVKVGVDELLEAQRVSAQTSAVLKSTGGAANVTANQITSLASSLSNMSGVDDEAIQAGQNLLLTFTNVRNEAGKNNDIFNQATAAALDMSVALDSDLKTANIQLGKALNDPIKGVGALQRVGVSFTADQKKQIETLVKSGKTMEAQKIILAELNKEFGGSAKKAGKTAQGSINRLKNSYAEMSATIISAVMPSLAGMANKLNALVNRVKAWAATRGGQETLAKMRAALGQAATAVGELASGLGRLIGWMIRNRDIIIPLATYMGVLVAGMKAYRIAVAGAAAAQSLFNVIMTMNPIGLIVVGVAALGAALIVAYKRSETFRNAVNPLIQKFREFSIVAVGAMQELWKRAQPVIPILKLIAQVWMKALIIQFRIWWTVVSNVYKMLFRVGRIGVQALQWVWAKAQPVIGVLKLIGRVYIASVISYFNTLRSIGVATWGAIRSAWSSATGLFARIRQGLNFSNAWHSLRDGFRAAINSVIGMWNRLEFRIPSLKVAGKEVFGGASIGTPDVPMLANGGNITRRGTVLIGERGPELLDLPRGARVTPLSKTGNTYNITVNTNGERVDTIAFMRSLRVAARMGTI